MVNDLTQGSPNRVLWRFCLPLFGSIVFQQLYNLADSLIAGKFIGEDALAAVGNSYEITLIYLAFAFGCNIGCSVVSARLFGEKRMTDLKTAVHTTFFTSGILCAVLTLLGFLLTPALMRLINTPEEIFGDSLLYLNVYTGGLFFLFFYNIANGVCSAMGDSVTPFCFLAVSSVTNIFLDWLFISAFDMGVAGVAWATFLCQGVSCLLAVLLLFRRLHRIPSEGKGKLFDGVIFRSILRIAIPSILQQSFVSVGNIVLQSLINSFGKAVVAGYSAAVKLNNFAINTFATLGTGISNYTAQNLGANKTDRVRRGYIAGLGMVAATVALFTTAYLLFSEPLIGAFMREKTKDAMDTGMNYLFILAPFYVFVAVKLLSDGVLRGAGRMRQFMITTFLDLILRVGLAFVFSAYWGVTGIWISWPFGWVISGMLSVTFYFLYARSLQKNKTP